MNNEMMSRDEDEEELYKMVAQTLELNGSLPKIRAQLRSNLFLSLDEDAQLSKLHTNNTLRSHLDHPKDFTISVLEPESNLGLWYKYEGRQKLSETLGLSDSELGGPLLLHLLEAAQKKSLKINLVNGTREDSSPESSIEEEVNGQESVVEEEMKNVTYDLNGSNKNIDSEVKSSDTSLETNKSKTVLNLSRTEILPSLYNKDFKERTSQDSDFDINDDYEEDFISGSEVDLSLKSKLATNSSNGQTEKTDSSSSLESARNSSWK